MSTPRKFRLGLIGCGPRGKDHVKAALRSECFDFAAVADLDAKRRDELADAFGAQARYADFREMLAQEKGLDVVHLCTQPTLRVAPVKAAVAAGVKAIVVEKPMALDYSEALQLQQLCTDAGTLLVVNHQKRNMVEWIKLKDAVTSGKLGKVVALRSSCYSNLLGQGTHMLDQAWNVLGEPAPLWLLAGVDARASEEGPNHPSPRNALLLIEYDNGVRGTFAIGNDSPPAPNSRGKYFWCNIEVLGSEGRAESVLDQGFRRWDRSGQLVESVVSRWDDEFQGAGQARLSADIARALSEPAFQHPQRGESALVSFAMLEAACRSARGGGKAVAFPIAPGEDALAHWTRSETAAGARKEQKRPALSLSQGAR